MDPNITPALAPPEGVVSSVSPSYALTGSQISLATVCMFLCVVSIVGRTYARVGILKQFDTSDVSLILSGATFAGFVAVKLIANRYGQGQHQWNVSVVNMGRVSLMANILEIIYGPSMFFAKYAVLRQIETIFYKHRRNKFASRTILVLIWANLVFYFSIMLSFIFACVPREKIIDSTLDGHCINSESSIIATSAINVFSDVTILIIPLAAVWKLQIPLKTKVGAGGVFAIGIFACITSIVRLVYSVSLFETEDLAWAIEPVGSWAFGEFTTVILVACFPLFPRLFNRLFDRGKVSSYQLSDNTQVKNNRLRMFHTPDQAIRLEDDNSTIGLREETGGAVRG